jgi:Fe-S cluster assembly scaffold protein SufB
MEAIDMIINNLPAPTWERLRMNRANVSGAALDGQGMVDCSGGLSLSAGDAQAFSTISTGSGKDVDHLLSAAGVTPVQLTVAAGACPAATRLNFSWAEGEKTGHQLLISLGEGSEATVLMDYTAPEGTSGTGAVQTKIKAEKNAHLRLVQIQRLGQGFTFFNDMGADCAEGAQVELIQLFLSGKTTYAGCETTLTGKNSRFNASLAYALSEEQKLDMNYVARHVGQHTESDMNAAGSLQGSSAKLFRGTIDFVKGCAGSVGNEKEEVLLIDENTVNQTIPLILCAEEDVEGNHGASLGKPDEEVLFYLAARGIPEAEAYALLARAKLDVVAGLIWDDDFKGEILNHIKGGAQDE